MTIEINEKEFTSILSLAAPERYSYWVKKVADQEALWGLGTKHGWALAADDSGQKLVPVWTHPQFAIACAVGEWANYEPKKIDLAGWLEHWIPGMVRDGKFVAVFPTPSDKGIAVSPSRLKEDLKRECSLYE